MGGVGRKERLSQDCSDEIESVLCTADDIRANYWR